MSVGLRRLLEALRSRSYEDGAICKLTQENWVRILARTWLQLVRGAEPPLIPAPRLQPPQRLGSPRATVFTPSTSASVARILVTYPAAPYPRVYLTKYRLRWTAERRHSAPLSCQCP